MGHKLLGMQFRRIMHFVELRVCLKEIIQQFSSATSYIPYFLHVFFYVPLVFFSHMKLLFRGFSFVKRLYCFNWNIFNKTRYQFLCQFLFKNANI